MLRDLRAQMSFQVGSALRNLKHIHNSARPLKGIIVLDAPSCRLEPLHQKIKLSALSNTQSIQFNLYSNNRHRFAEIPFRLLPSQGRDEGATPPVPKTGCSNSDGAFSIKVARMKLRMICGEDNHSCSLPQAIRSIQFCSLGLLGARQQLGAMGRIQPHDGFPVTRSFRPSSSHSMASPIQITRRRKTHETVFSQYRGLTCLIH